MKNDNLKLKKKPRLGVIIIAQDEEKMIGECLDSVKWADEIIVVDNDSVDKTVEIAKKYKARVIKVSTGGEKDYSKLRNAGLRTAKNDWIFYLDADERVTPELKKEIFQAINVQHSVIAYALPRRNFYLGKKVRFGGAWPDFVIRLFKKNYLRKWQGKLHEQPLYKGKLGYLKEPLVHLTHRDLSSMVEKTRLWSKVEAELLYQANHPPVTWWRVIRIMLTEFWYRAIKLQAWRDGTVGWIEIIFQMFSRFITYARLWELQQEKR